MRVTAPGIEGSAVANSYTSGSHGIDCQRPIFECCWRPHPVSTSLISPLMPFVSVINLLSCLTFVLINVHVDAALKKNNPRTETARIRTTPGEPSHGDRQKVYSVCTGLFGSSIELYSSPSRALDKSNIRTSLSPMLSAAFSSDGRLPGTAGSSRCTASSV